MNNNELDNTIQDNSEEAIDKNKANEVTAASKEGGEAGSSGSAAQNSAEKSQQSGSIFTVGGGSAGSYSSGEYSYGKKEEIPDYRYAFTQSAHEPRGREAKPRNKNSGKSWLIAAVITGVILLTAFAGLGGALLAGGGNRDGNDTMLGNQNTTETSAPAETNTGGSSAIIIKNNGSVSVETVGGNIGDSNLTIPDVVALVKDSVVEISTEKGDYNGRYVVSGAGSGVIIGRSEDGKTVYIATNNHVIEGADSITVRLTNGNEYSATLRGTDSSSDLAVLTLAAKEPVTVAQLGSSATLRVGEEIIAIGNPLGELGGTVTNGIISALAREVEIDGADMTLLQISAPVNPGNSGGGLFNMRGELIGVVNAKSSGADIDNIGFAIPIDTAFEIMSELIEYGYVTGRVELGLTLIDVNDSFTAWRYGVNALGVYIYDSKYSDEVKSGDRVVSVNGIEVSSTADIKSALGDCEVGDVVTVRVSRKGKQYDVEITLREYIPASAEATDDK